jgi:hypothetical protein
MFQFGWLGCQKFVMIVYIKEKLKITIGFYNYFLIASNIYD